MSRQTFLQGLNAALGTSISGFPDPAAVRRYFATLNGEEAIRAYEDYASSFYVHIVNVSASSNADVVYPGGSCDRWVEVTRRRRSGSRRIIDCEGFAFIAHQLLGAAGFQQLGYQVFYLPTPGRPTDWHIVAVLQVPRGSGRLFVGGPEVSRRAFDEMHRVFPSRSHDARSAQIGDTPGQAIENMQRDAAAGHTREIAPLPPRRPARVPPVMAE
jgi:hypothetical protein